MYRPQAQLIALWFVQGVFLGKATAGTEASAEMSSHVRMGRWLMGDADEEKDQTKRGSNTWEYPGLD